MSAWPTVTISTANADAPSDDPSQFRSDIHSLILKFNDMIGARAQANGVASLDATGVVPASELAKAVLLTGGTMTGFLTANADPTAALHYATKQYVDAQIAGSSPFATGVTALFRNTTVSGWTKDTAFNEHAIRIVTGATLSAGGTTNLTTVFGSGKTTSSHILTASECALPNHFHTISSASGGGGNTDGTDRVKTVSNPQTHTETTSSASTSTAASGHDHGLSLDLKFVDFAIFRKD